LDLIRSKFHQFSDPEFVFKTCIAIKFVDDDDDNDDDLVCPLLRQHIKFQQSVAEILMI